MRASKDRGSRMLACWGDRRCDEASPGWHSPEVQRGQRGQRAVCCDRDQTAVQALQRAAGSLDEPTAQARVIVTSTSTWPCFCYTRRCKGVWQLTLSAQQLGPLMSHDNEPATHMPSDS